MADFNADGRPDAAVTHTTSAKVTVLLNDGNWSTQPLPPPSISISDFSKAEGKKGKTTLFTFTVTLSAAYDQPVTMSYRTANGTATTSNSDYVAKTGTLTFAPGETTKTITIEVKGDSKREANETFYLDLFGLQQQCVSSPRTAASARSSTTTDRAIEKQLLPPKGRVEFFGAY